jgi:hypothetical protein
MKPDQIDPIHTLDPDHLLRLGECVRDLIVLLGYKASDLEDRLFREVVAEAITILTSRQHMHEFWRERQADALPEVLPIPMEYLAETVINRAFSDGISHPPPEQEQVVCIEVALKLDPTCSDAYLLKGTIAERHGDYEQAKGAYEKAMELAATKLGSDVFEASLREKQEFHFWYSDGSRPYMRSRAALAYLLSTAPRGVPQILTPLANEVDPLWGGLEHGSRVRRASSFKVPQKLSIKCVIVAISLCFRRLKFGPG